MLYGIVGRKGSGKTLLMTYFLKKYYDKSKENNEELKIYTNYMLNDIDFEVINFKKLFQKNIKISNSVVAIDEIYLLADSRTPSSKMNRIISYMLYQTRKANVDIFFTAVSFKSIELRLRVNNDGLFFPNMYINDKKVLNPENLTQKKVEELIKNNNKINIKGLFYNDYSEVKRFSVDNPIDYFKYYSSYEIIQPEGLGGDQKTLKY